jgi:1,6-anhydro-N-acetylmuramate kinase
LFVGLMSGTSLDGVDAALVELAPPRPALINSAYVPLPEALRAELHALQSPGPNELDRAARAGNELSRLYAEAVLALLKQAGMSPAAATARPFATAPTPATPCRSATRRCLPSLPASAWSRIFAAATSPPAARVRRWSRPFRYCGYVGT